MRRFALALMLLTLSACESLPHDGPAMRMVQSQGRAGAQGGYALLDLDVATAQRIAASTPTPMQSLASDSSSAPIDRIGEGDVLSVTILEQGGGLFANQSGSTQAVDRGDFHVAVDGEGFVGLPFAGRVHLAGDTPAQASDAIKAALRGKAINPQVLVGVADSRANSVTVIGEVRNAGRFNLSPNGDHLLDLIASAGGPTRPIPDLTVFVARGPSVASIPLAQLMSQARENIRLAPGDQVRIIFKARKFSTFGAFGHSAQIPIEDDTLSLSAAMGSAGGLDPGSANAAYVYDFRFERPEVAQALGVTTPPSPKGVPIVYRLNLRDPKGYFIATTFEVQPEDILYVPRSDVTELKKYLELVTSVSQVAYNIRVTSVIH